MDKTTDAKILIIEDELITAKAIEKSLKRFGYEVVGIATDAKAGLQEVINKKPDLILMDITLKGEQDGVTLTQNIKVFTDIPIIYLTAHSDQPTIKRAVHTNPFGYLLKPFDDDGLHEAVHNSIERYRKFKAQG